MNTKTYTVNAEWDSGKPSGQGSFTRTGQTAEQAQQIRNDLRASAPVGSTHSVEVIAE